MLLYTATLLDMTFSIVYGLRIILLWTSNPVSFAPQEPPLPYTGSSCIYSNVAGLKPVVRKHNTWNGYICWQIKWQIKWQIMTWRRTCICNCTVYSMFERLKLRGLILEQSCLDIRSGFERETFSVFLHILYVFVRLSGSFLQKRQDLKLVISHIRPDHSIL